ncbi:MAG: hypothetical protein M1817_005770 [Caeruleum heppii]|nr:MAG: hypothetical protein M1817_005770 [Caeruleum heppii]
MPPWLLTFASLPPHCTPTSPILTHISTAFSTCIPTPFAFLSSLLGCLSILSWLFAQLPQIYKNHALQSTAGLSIWFLVEWCLGDLCNLLGALFTDQATWQVIVAGYYVCVDVVLVGQYYWFTYLKKRRKRRLDDWSPQRWQGGLDGMNSMESVIEGVSPPHPPFDRTTGQKQGNSKDDLLSASPRSISRPPLFDPPAPDDISSSSTPPANPSPRTTSVRRPYSPIISPRTVLTLSLLCTLATTHSSPLQSSPPPAQQPLSTAPPTLGTLLSWTSTLLYLLSRLPQILHNLHRRSTAGLSPTLFLAAFFGNLFYSTSLLTNPFAWNDFPPGGGHGWAGPAGSLKDDWRARAMPFFLGAAGVLGLDAVVGLQFLVFGAGVAEGDPSPSSLLSVPPSSTGKEHDDPDRGRWRRVSGWMRGWVPRMLSPESRERIKDQGRDRARREERASLLSRGSGDSGYGTV